MQSRTFKAFVASVLILASISTWSAPAWALRPTSEKENQSGLEELTHALTVGDLDKAGQTAMRLASAAIPSEPARNPVTVGLPPAISPRQAAAGLEEGLDDLLEQARSGAGQERLKAIQNLGNFFSAITIERFPLGSFDGRVRRVLPDLAPVTGYGAIGVFLEGGVGSRDKKMVDQTSAAKMRPAVERAVRIAGYNWWNKAGEGLRDGLTPDVQIPPMEEPIIFHPGWPMAETSNDPVDGTTRTSKGQDGGVTLFMVTPQFGKTFPDELRAENVLYTGRKAEFSLKRDSYETIFQRIAAANHRSLKHYEVWILNRPHHRELIEAAKRAGVPEEKIRLYQDGTVQPVLYMAAFPQRHIIIAGRVGATESKMVAAPLRNVRYPDGGRAWAQFRIISENSGYEVEEKKNPDGVVYYEPRLDGQKKPIVSNSLKNGNRLSLRDIRALREAGYSDADITNIQDGSLEFDLDELAPAAGDIFLSYITEPMTDIHGKPLYDWGMEVHGVRRAEGKVAVDTLEFTAASWEIVRHTYPDKGVGVITGQLAEQERVVNSLRRLIREGAGGEVESFAKEALQKFLPHSVSLDLQRQAALAIQGFTAGLEEATVEEALVSLDDPSLEARLQALRTLRKLEQSGVPVTRIRTVEPKGLGSWLHIHTTASYPSLPGVFSPAHMIWAAHQAGADVVGLVDHETLAHVREGFQAAQIVNGGAEKPMRVLYGVEFKAPVHSRRTELRAALHRGVAAGYDAWVVGWGVPVGPNGEIPEELVQMVDQFQRAKLARANEQTSILRSQKKINIYLADLLAISPDGKNITDRQLSYSAAILAPGLVDSTQLQREADQIRREILAKFPLLSVYGFPKYEQVVSQLTELGMVPTFTMQVQVPDLQKLVPELRKIGIQAFDLAGIEHHHPNAVADIQQVIDLAEQYDMPVIGGSDYRGEGAIGWPTAADWMKDPVLATSIEQLLGRGATPAPAEDDYFDRFADHFGAGLEEAPAPIIGFLQRPAVEISAKGQARRLREAVAAIVEEQKYRQGHSQQPKQPMYARFDDTFGQLLRQTGGNMQVLADLFLESRVFYRQENLLSHEQAMMKAVKRLAQDPGAPHDKPPVSYYNPARYIYARLRSEALDRFRQEALDGLVETLWKFKLARLADLSVIEQKAILVQDLQTALDPKGLGRITQGPYQYEVLYDSLVEKEGEVYLTLELLLDGEKDYREGVVLELQVILPARSKPLQYKGPYPLTAGGLAATTLFAIPYAVDLLDPLHFINTRFPEWRPVAQRDIYESRIQTLKVTHGQARGEVKRQYIRPSVRQGNNPRFFEPFFREYLVGDVPFVYHIVDALSSERDYGNQGGVPSVGNLASAIVRRGGLGATATWLLEEPEVVRPLIEEKRTLVYSYEKDHHRIDGTDLKSFSSELERFLAAYWEGAMTGWPSANLQDETKFEVVKVRDPWMALALIAESGGGSMKEVKRDLLVKQYIGSLYDIKATDKKLAQEEQEALAAIRKRIDEAKGLDSVSTDELLMRIQARLKPVLSETELAELLRAGPQHILAAGVIHPITSRLLQAVYAESLNKDVPSALGLHWLRNRYMRHVVETVRAQGVQVTPYREWYIEPDYALDGKPHTVEEMAYLTLVSWVSAQAHGHKLGPVVPSYGNVHGASAGDPNLVLAGVLQYAAQAATLYGTPLFEGDPILKIARKAPLGSIEKAKIYAAHFQDQALARDFVRVIESAGERTSEEEAALGRYIFQQLRLIPSDLLEALKEAELARKPLADVAPEIATVLDKRIQQLDLSRRAAITTHAASGLSAEQLAQAREAGVWVANKSTEFQNVITKMLELAYLQAVHSDRLEEEFKNLPAFVREYLEKHPFSPQDLEQVRAAYPKMYEKAVRLTVLKSQSEAEKQALQQEIATGRFTFPWYWRDQDGWSMKDHAGKSWEKTHKGLPGEYGRYMFSMRDKMTKEGVDDTLFFPNELTWGFPRGVITLAEKVIRHTIRFYHADQVMNARGGAAEYRAYIAAKPTAAGLEERWLTPAEAMKLFSHLQQEGERILVRDLFLGSSPAPASRWDDEGGTVSVVRDSNVELRVTPDGGLEVSKEIGRTKRWETFPNDGFYIVGNYREVTHISPELITRGYFKKGTRWGKAEDFYSAGLEEAGGVATVEAPVRETMRRQETPVAPLELIFRPENAGLALLVPREGVKVRIIVADAEQSAVIESRRPDLAGSFISIEDVGSLETALTFARQELGSEAREVTEILDKRTLAQKVKLWLQQFPWIAPALDNALLRDIELGTQL